MPFATLWASAWAAVRFGYWELSFLLAIPAAAFLVRLFVIQHDCGHGSFFRYRLANDWTGRFLSVLTLTPMMTGGAHMRSITQTLVIWTVEELAILTR